MTPAQLAAQERERELEPPSRCPKCDAPFLLCMAEIQTFGEHICLSPPETRTGASSPRPSGETP